jgi:2,3-bisphosphoglycerate-dependent phosphoglycerate mutase
MLVLIRHAMPVVEPGVPPHRWQLGEEGRAQARALGRDIRAIPRPAYFVASDEPKAAQTIREMTDADVPLDPGFAEVRRPSSWSDDYRSLARAYADGEAHAGWESHAAVARRFDEAVSRHGAAAGADGAILVVGTHGLAPTVWLASRLRLAPSPGAFWAALRFPDAIHVALDERRAVAVSSVARSSGRDTRHR